MKLSDWFDTPDNLRASFQLGKEVARQTDGEDLDEETLDDIAESAGVDLTSSLSNILYDLGTLLGKNGK